MEPDVEGKVICTPAAGPHDDLGTRKPHKEYVQNVFQCFDDMVNIIDRVGDLLQQACGPGGLNFQQESSHHLLFAPEALAIKALAEPSPSEDNPLLCSMKSR